MIYNAAEPQSQLAYDHIQQQCKLLGLELYSQSVANSSETTLIVESLIRQGIHVFFAMPDNSVFASFESIVASCNKANVPIYTSEAGLVARGALAAFGADMYQWGHQAGLQAAAFLKQPKAKLPSYQLVNIRSRMINQKVAARFGIVADSSFVVQ